MEFGSSLQLFALEVDLLQGIVNFLHEALPQFRTVEDPDGNYTLELDPPNVEIRDDGDYRLGIHLTGKLFIGAEPNPFIFDAWVRIRPEVGTNENAELVGILVFDSIEEVTPATAEDAVADAFSPEGEFGKALKSLELDVFKSLTESVHSQLFPLTPYDPANFDVAFYLGKPASMSRPVWDIKREDGQYVPDLKFDVSYATVPALVASVALAGQDPIPPEAPSIVRSDTGLALITTAKLFEQRFALESIGLVGTEVNGLTIDRFEASSTDYGFDILGEGHKTGADVSFSGPMVTQFKGGVGGEVIMRSLVETDVDSAWWVDLLSVVAAMIPGIGWFFGDLLILGPTNEAPGDVESALLDKFLAPLTNAATLISTQFSIPVIPTEAFLADVWFFDGNMAVVASAFAGKNTSSVKAVYRDIAYLAKDPAGVGQHTNRRRPVESVQDIVLSNGHTLKPWQAGFLVSNGLLNIPGHHAVNNPLAKGGVYLRSNPDDNLSNNLLG